MMASDEVIRARKRLAHQITQPVVRLLTRTPVSPNIISWSGFLVAAIGALLIISGNLFAAGFVVLIAGFFDILDGALARNTNRATQFGAVLDATLDRLSEALLFLGILALILFSREGSALFTPLSKEWAALLVGVTIPGSQLVSYIRARAEAQDLGCSTGVFTRSERVIVLALGLLLSRFSYALITSLAVILVFSYITAGHRLFHVWRQTRT